MLVLSFVVVDVFVLFELYLLFVLGFRAIRVIVGLEFDLMFLFEVKVSQSLKTEIVNNNATLRMYAVQKPADVLFTSTSLNNLVVTKGREKAPDKDPVDNEVDRLLKMVDEKGFAVSDMPPLQPEHALQRVTRLSSSPDDPPLARLVEIRAFKAMRLISNQQYADGVKAIIEAERGDILLKAGKEEDRKPALASYLPRKGRK